MEASLDALIADARSLYTVGLCGEDPPKRRETVERYRDLYTELYLPYAGRMDGFSKKVSEAFSTVESYLSPPRENTLDEIFAVGEALAALSAYLSVLQQDAQGKL